MGASKIAFLNPGTSQLRTYSFDGTNWSQVGDSLSVTTSPKGVVCALSDSTIALVKFGADGIGTYRFNGTNWALVGAHLGMTSVTNASVCALSGSYVAVAHTNINTIQWYFWNGSSWALSGVASANLGGLTYPVMCPLSNSRIAYYEYNVHLLKTYDVLLDSPPPSPAFGTL